MPADNELFIVANLALWAGDAQGADDRLSAVLRAHQATRRTIHAFDSPLVSSSQRSLRQLRKRIADHRRLGGLANLSSNHMNPQKPLQSNGGHLSAIIWVESEREFELRCYLHDLSWEAAFYKSAARLSNDVIAASHVATLHYGSDQVSTPLATGASTTESTLGLEWTEAMNSMLLEVAVSDFCTCSVRGLWNGKKPPESADVLVSAFQDFLDRFDPGS